MSRPLWCAPRYASLEPVQGFFLYRLFLLPDFFDIKSNWWDYYFNVKRLLA